MTFSYLVRIYAHSLIRPLLYKWIIIEFGYIFYRPGIYLRIYHLHIFFVGCLLTCEYLLIRNHYFIEINKLFMTNIIILFTGNWLFMAVLNGREEQNTSFFIPSMDALNFFSKQYNMV